MDGTKKYIFGVDIGGTNIKLGMFDNKAALIEKCEFPTPKENGKEGLASAVRDNVLTLLSKHNASGGSIIGLGLGFPGAMDSDGYISSSPSLALYDCNPTKYISEILNAPAFCENDASLAALGEFSFGAGKLYKSIVMLTLGTGLGAGIVIDGKLLRSPRGGVGEIGHIPTNDRETDACGCGKHGCLQQYVSATGLVRLAKRALEKSDVPSILRGKILSAKCVFDAVKANDKLALSIADEFSYYFGRGLATVATVVNPDAFIIGGGVSKAGDIIIDLMKPYYLKFAHKTSANASFRIANLGNDAGIYGCAKFVLNSLSL